MFLGIVFPFYTNGAILKNVFYDSIFLHGGGRKQQLWVMEIWVFKFLIACQQPPENRNHAFFFLRIVNTSLLFIAFEMP